MITGRLSLHIKLQIPEPVIDHQYSPWAFWSNVFMSCLIIQGSGVQGTFYRHNELLFLKLECITLTEWIQTVQLCGNLERLYRLSSCLIQWCRLQNSMFNQGTSLWLCIMTQRSCSNKTTKLLMVISDMSNESDTGDEAIRERSLQSGIFHSGQLKSFILRYD